MISMIAISAMLLATPQPARTASYQLPDLLSCNKDTCPIKLDGDGYLIDAASKNRILSKPVEQTAFNSYSLFRSGRKFILELENTSSSRNWATIVLTYDRGKVHALRYISLSRNVTASIKGGNPDTVQWSGRDCRGNETLNGQDNSFKSALLALCADHDKEDVAALPKTDTVKEAASKGLVVTIPSYGPNSPVDQKTTYFFPQADEPDATALLCLTNCGTPDDEVRLGGWIGKSLWIDVKLRHETGNNFVGSYLYVGKNTSIPLQGELSQNNLQLEEFDPSDFNRKEKSVATMTMICIEDAFAGTWSSKTTAKKFNMLLAHRIY